MHDKIVEQVNKTIEMERTSQNLKAQFTVLLKINRKKL